MRHRCKQAQETPGPPVAQLLSSVCQNKCAGLHPQRAFRWSSGRPPAYGCARERPKADVSRKVLELFREGRIVVGR